MTLMEKEILETAAVLRAHRQRSDLPAYAAALQENPPTLLLTAARGTSAHAGEYLSYLLMRYRGIPAMAVPLSLNTLYHSRWQLDNVLLLAISQSGGSRDLRDSVENLRQAAGVRSLALVNVVDSPLAQACETVIDIGAGEEKSVAATKSFIATLAVGLRLLAPLFGDKTLLSALDALPEKIEAAQALDWTAAAQALRECERLFVIGRGTGLSIAKEAALKCKETCALQGEALSGAEVQHGPMALMGEKQTVIILAPPDEAQEGLFALAEKFRSMGAKVLLAAERGGDLPLIDAGHSALQGLTTIQTFYRMAEKLSALRGVSTDNPPHLNKVTSTQ